MRISEAHIDGFGTWRDLSLENIGDGVTVVYGPNEAGKTTLMQFMRTMLYGFSEQRRHRYLPPLNGGRPGGALAIVANAATESGTAMYRVVRHAAMDDPQGYLGDVTIVAPDGAIQGHSQLEQLLVGVDESTFNNVFALGLREIQELGSLDDTAAADHLYRLTGGLDRVSLVDVVRELQGSRQRIVGESPHAKLPHRPSEKTTPQPGLITGLIARRDKLREELRELSGRTDRWLKLAALRSELIEETKTLDRDIAELEEQVRVIDVALQARELWTARCQVLAKLEKLGTPKEIRKKYVELLKKYNERITASNAKVAQLKEQRKKISDEAKAIKINHVVWGQATRIEALTEHSGWVQTLETQIERLKNELGSYEQNLQTQTVSAGSPGFDISLANQQTIQALRRPMKLIGDEEERLETAKRNVEDAKAEYEALVAKIEQRLTERNETDLQTAVQNAGERIALYRRRIQIEQRLDQLGRHRDELEQYRDDLFERNVLPVWTTVGLGVLFATGIMLMLMATFAAFDYFVLTGTPPGALGLIGFMLTALSAAAKVGLEKQAGNKLDSVRKQLTMLNRQYGDVKQQRDELDAQLPTASGALDVRLQRAEEDLRRLEEMVPQQAQRDALKAKVDAAKRQEVEAEAAVKEARGRYKAMLRSLGLPEGFSINTLRQHSQKGEELSQSRRQVEIVRDELVQRERELLSLATRIDQLMGDIRVKPTSDRPQDRLAQLAKVVEEQRDLNLLKGDLRRQVRQLRKEWEQATRLVKRDERSREAIFAKNGVRNEKEFHRAVDRWRHFRFATKKRKELTEKILATLAERITEEQLEEVLSGAGFQPAREETNSGQAGSLPHLSVEARRELALAKIRDFRLRLGQLQERRGQAQQEMTMLADDRRYDEVKVELACAQQQLAEQMRRWQVLAATEHTLASVRKIYETNRQPETLREASEYLKQLTSGHYVRIWTAIEDRTLTVDDANNKPVRLDVLSRGTREAIFLSLRLALVNSFARRGAKLPLVLDDVLVNFDTGRVKAAAALLRDFAKQHRHQILMFTCHEHIMRIFKGAKVDVRTLPGHELPVEEIEKPKRKKVEPEPKPVEEILLLPAPAPAPAPPPEPVRVTVEAIESVPDFHEFGYQVRDDIRTLSDLWSQPYDVYGTDEVDAAPPKRPAPPPAKPAVRHDPPPPKRKPVAVAPQNGFYRQRFAWESPERYAEEFDEEEHVSYRD
jgi:uncharacterized protein YhaN